LRAEILHRQNANTGEAFELLASDAKNAAPIFLGITECADANVDFTAAVRLVPILRIIAAFVSEVPRARPIPSASSEPRICFFIASRTVWRLRSKSGSFYSTSGLERTKF
jgi:hypothetical protein